MQILAIFAPVLAWVFRAVVVKFVLLTGVMAVVAFLVPVAIGYIGNWLEVGALNSAFSGLPASVWWWLDIMELGYGLPLLISAAVTRFLIRRLPFIG